jgi:di/tricarboxylate transporter
MTLQSVTFLILFVAVLALLLGKPRPDVVALLATLALGLTGVLAPQEVFAGLSRPAVVTILAVFILAEGLRTAGVAARLGEFLLRLGGKNEFWMIVIITLSGATLSLVMNNIAAAAVLLPAVSSAARKANVSLSKLMMPLAYGTILGGMATLLTSSNIVVSSTLIEHGYTGFGLLDFAPLGVPIVLTGSVYLALVGRRWLPEQSPVQRMAQEQPAVDLFDIYRLGERLVAGRIPQESTLVGQSLQQSGLREGYNLNVVALRRGGRILSPLQPTTRLEAGDQLLLEGRPGDLSPQALAPLLQIMQPADWDETDLERGGAQLVEAVLTPRSHWIGQTLRQVQFREKFGVNVLAIWRSGRSIRTRLWELPLQFGDALLLQASPQNLALLQSEPEVLVLFNHRRAPVAAGKFWSGLGLALVALILAIVFPNRTAEWFLLGALGMVVSGVLSMDQAYRAVDWRSVFLVAGMLPLGTAMIQTGAAASLANGLLRLLEPYGAAMILIGLFLATTLLVQALNGAAAAAMIAPVALAAAQQAGLNPHALGMAVALAASMAFITPLGHPVNILVMGPGGYTFRDYARVGAPLALLLSLLILGLLPLVWPLR